MESRIIIRASLLIRVWSEVKRNNFSSWVFLDVLQNASFFGNSGVWGIMEIMIFNDVVFFFFLPN